MCYHCFDVLINTLSSRNTNRNELPEFSKELTNISVECPLFLTWEKKGNNGSWQLRGCIGTLSPRLLVASIGEYAVTSALRDRRFHPIGISEVSSFVFFMDSYSWTCAGICTSTPESVYIGQHGVTRIQCCAQHSMGPEFHWSWG